MSVWLDHNRLRELQGTLEEKGFHTVNDLLSILSMGIADVAQMLNGDYPKSIKLIGALKLVKQ